MCITSKKTNFNCCICLQSKQNVIKCIKCKNAVVCYICINSMCEEGLCNKCPLCRQTGWKKAIKKNKVVPITKNSAIFIESKSKETLYQHFCKKCLLKITKPLILLINSYLAGLLTLLTFIGIDFDFKLYWLVPLIIGLFEFIILISCCYGCCGIKKGINEICF